MMTTESPRDLRSSGSTPLLGALAAGLLLVLGAGLAGAVVSGSAAALGAVVGAGLAVGVLAFGSFPVNVVAGLMPAASLMVALLTYLLQVMLMVVILVGISRSGLVGDTLDRLWLGGAAIAGTLLWMVVQVVLTTRLRIPAYEPVPVRVEAGQR